MKIHHSIVKTAAAKGVILTADADGEIFAHHTESNTQVGKDGAEAAADDEGQTDFNELARDALRDCLEVRDWNEEHPTMKIVFEEGDFVAYHRKGRGLGDEIARDPELADLLVSIQEADEDEGDEPEEGAGSVVPAKYKVIYAERGDATHCGDWLALTLNRLCKVMDGKKEVTDLDRLETIATANGVEAARVDRLGTATNGWQGRYRMTVRNMLAKVVAGKGHLFVPDGCGAEGDVEMEAPRDWVLAHSPKPKEVAKPKAAPEVKAADKPSGKKSAKVKAQA